MSIVTSIWQELLRRRLLPVAILLLGALVAIPVLLAKDPEPPAPVPQSSTPANVATASEEPIVSLVEEGERTKRRRVLGARKDPFEPAPVKAPKPPEPVTGSSPSSGSAATPVTGGTDAGNPSGGSTAPATGGGAPTGGTVPTGPVAPPAGTAPAPRKRHEVYSLTVRFGGSESEALEKMTLPRLKALPDATEAFLVYLGVSADKKRAVFMVDAGVRAQGDGVCRPNPVTCETIELAEGETEFFDVPAEGQGELPAATDESSGSQYQLDVLKIHRKPSAGAKAAAARARQAVAGRKLLRAVVADRGPLRYRYDVESGTMRRLKPKAYRALVAKTARARVLRAAEAAAGGFDVER